MAWEVRMWPRVEGGERVPNSQRTGLSFVGRRILRDLLLQSSGFGLMKRFTPMHLNFKRGKNYNEGKEMWEMVRGG